MTEPLILVDGSSYFFRAFHALPPLTNSKGKPTGAIYGVANMIKRLMKDYQSNHIAVIFDAKGKTFRDDMYPEYKAHRAPMPDDLHCQFEPLVCLLSAMGLPLLTIEGVEADDVIGTLAKIATNQGIPVVISTGDKDMAQLVNANISLINTMSGQKLDKHGVFAKFGVHPEQIIDYLSLIGDSVDNIPGVPKCGPKTAAKWLAEYQTLEDLMVQADKISGKIGENLRASLSYLPLSKRLVTIKTDVALAVELSDLFLKSVDRNRLIELTREFEFKTWLKELLEQNQSQSIDETAKKPLDFTIVDQRSSLENLINKLMASSITSFFAHTETNNFHQNELIGFAFASENLSPVYLPLIDEYLQDGLTGELIIQALKPYFSASHLLKISHDFKTTYSLLKKCGIHLAGLSQDTMLASYVLNSASGTHDLPSLSLKYLGHNPQFSLTQKGTKQLGFDFDLGKCASYAVENAVLNLQLQQKFSSLLEEPLKRVLDEIEMPLLCVLAEMELRGVLVDLDCLAKHGARLKTRIAELEAEALSISGRAFNLNSPKQLQEILFDELRLPIMSKTPTGQPSTAESVLQELAYDYRLPAVILEFRSLSKLVSTYIDALPKRVNPQSGRVHTSYNQAVAATGRLSSSDPNLQNIPIRSEEGRLIRTAFIAPPGYKILAADYSQIELRIMAHLSQDPNLLLAFANDWDIHAATASEIFQVPLTEVTAEQRRRTKAVNFGLIYGMSAFGLAKQLGIERQDAQFYMDCYFKRYPGVLQYMERSRQLARQQGYVETLFGRRLYIPEINTKNLVRQRAAERIAINAPMQGTAADIIKRAMLAINIWQKEQAENRFQMIMQVHDELVFEVREEAVTELKTKLCQLMENAATLSVPLRVSVGVGDNWGEAH